MAAGLEPGALEFAELGFVGLTEFRSGLGLGFGVLMVEFLGLALFGEFQTSNQRG